MIKEDTVTKIKKKLRSYKEEEIEYNDPHVKIQMILREGSKEEIVKHILNPQHLVHIEITKGKYGDTIYNLYFKLSNTRTLKLPVMFDKDGKKSLYILTYIKRYRAWQNMIRRRKR